ncbi:IS630 family transposase [Acidihalobacter ferrooxydans]|uniref:IS630 family transposase n=1 Tax=Acidihalobacter ferrooxydans TaxID=1765967 RepID=A0A1P8UIU8_9GAMM|nr:IS630 family transposase [Acidihalobacter ferrooxydans]APZ43758.1 IS630 family transposase [Acidihalobacter ferrooxydans]
MRVAPQITLSEETQKQLEQLARSNTVSVREARRASIILLAAQGKTNHEIADALGIGRMQVGRWRHRYINEGWEAVAQDRPRGGRASRVDSQEIVRLTTRTKPVNATHWSTRQLAEVAGVSASTIRRIWQAHGLKPHRIKTFKVSRDPKFVEKLEDIVGLYLSPPEHALVLCCDEKSQVQALDRTQPGLPLKKGRAQTMTHDYKRHGTTTLFAALNVLNGQVIGQCQQRHTHAQWLKFLRQIDRETPKKKDLHLICDNYATHKHPKVREWLEKHPRFHMHFTPTSASWLNRVERFFRDLTTQRLRRGVFSSVPELIESINTYIEQHNQNPKPFIWTAKAKDILEKVVRANRKLSSKQNDALH